MQTLAYSTSFRKNEMLRQALRSSRKQLGSSRKELGSSEKQLAAEEHHLAPLLGIIADVSILSLAGSSADAQVSSAQAVNEIWDISSDDEPNVVITKEERPSIRRMNAQDFAELSSSVSGFRPNQNCDVRWLTFATMEAFLGNEEAIDS